MALGRMLHASTLLPDGRVLTSGGYNRMTEVYDPATGAWSRAADSLNTFRSATAIRLFNGQVLVAGAGGAEWNSGITAALYNSVTGSWSATGGMLIPRFHHTATLLQDGRVLVIGGSASEYSSAALDLAEVYDPATGLWTQASALSVPRRGHTATLLSDGKVLVAGGSNGGAALVSAEVYDPDTNTWSPVGGMSVARTAHSAILLPDSRVLVTGGGGTDWAGSASAEVFNPADGSWRATASMARPRRQHSATLLSTGLVLVAGGFHEYTGIQAAAEVYDAVAGSWHPAGNMVADRYQHTATLLGNGQVLVAGGFSNTSQSSAELFNPDTVAIPEPAPEPEKTYEQLPTPSELMTLLRETIREPVDTPEEQQALAEVEQELTAYQYVPSGTLEQPPAQPVAQDEPVGNSFLEDSTTVRTLLESTFGDEVKVSCGVPPCILYGDFDGNGQRDMAVQVASRADFDAGIAFVLSGQPIVLLGAGNPGPLGDDYLWMRGWTVAAAAPGSGFAGTSLVLLGEPEQAVAGLDANRQPVSQWTVPPPPEEP
jgi:hypothetical protein